MENLTRITCVGGFVLRGLFVAVIVVLCKSLKSAVSQVSTGVFSPKNTLEVDNRGHYIIAQYIIY